MLVLKLLVKKKCTGIIISELKVKSRERFLLKEGTLYPILYRLKDCSLVKSYWREVQGKGIPREFIIRLRRRDVTL